MRQKNAYVTPHEQAAYEKGLKRGRIEGMIAYQKHLVKNLQKENVILVEQLSSGKINDDIAGLNL